MKPRKGVRLEGIPYTWETNLDDDEIRELYGLIQGNLAARPPGSTDDVLKGSGPGISISLDLDSLFIAEVPFRDGMCLCGGFDGVLYVTYRTHGEWEALRREDREMLEARGREERREEVDAFLHRTRDQELQDQTLLAIDLGEYERADALISERLGLLKQACGGDWEFESLEVIGDALTAYSAFPTSANGIAFLHRTEPDPVTFLEFAQSYLDLNRSSSGAKVDQVDLVVRAATDLFPDDGECHASAALFWRRQGDYPRAAFYCRLAISRNLSDRTKSGFPGRLKRLRKEAERAGCPLPPEKE
jgi:hypothetical protein